MKKYIKSNNCLGYGMTLRQWMNDFGDDLEGAHIIISCLQPYLDEYPEDIPGVLFDGTIEELKCTPKETFDDSMDNYLLQDDLDTCTIVECNNLSDGIELIVENFV